MFYTLVRYILLVAVLIEMNIVIIEFVEYNEKLLMCNLRKLFGG